MDLQSLEDKSRHQIKQLITHDYLDFCLGYTIGSANYSFSLNNGCHVSLLADGVLGINLDKADKSAKSIVLSCGIHGNETAPIEICNMLVHRILNQELLTRHRVLFIFGNIAAMEAGKRFIDENLNRLFVRGEQFNDKELNYEQARANEIKTIVDGFFRTQTSEKIHYDLHTAIRPSKNEKFAVYPYLHGRPYNLEQLAFLSACDVNTILLSQSPTGTFSYYSSYHHNADAFTVELGKVMPFGKNDMSKFTKVKRMLIELLSEKQVILSDFKRCPVTVYQVKQVINKEYDDFALSFSDDIANFTTFNKGEVLARQNNMSITAIENGEAIVFPNANVKVGQRAMLTVVPHEL